MKDLLVLLKTQYGESEVTPEKFAFAPRHRAIAPFLPTRKPDFWAKRKLKIEERIEKRKKSLRDRLEQKREDALGPAGKGRTAPRDQSQGSQAPARRKTECAAHTPRKIQGNDAERRP